MLIVGDLVQFKLENYGQGWWNMPSFDRKDIDRFLDDKKKLFREPYFPDEIKHISYVPKLLNNGYDEIDHVAVKSFLYKDYSNNNGSYGGIFKPSKIETKVSNDGEVKKSSFPKKYAMTILEIKDNSHLIPSFLTDEMKQKSTICIYKCMMFPEPTKTKVIWVKSNHVEELTDVSYYDQFMLDVQKLCKTISK